MSSPFPKHIRLGTLYNEQSLPKIINAKKLFEIVPIVILENQIYSEKAQKIYKYMPEYRDDLFQSIKNKILTISKNIYGNHLIRVILNTKEKEKINIIFSELKKNIKLFSLDDNATFAIQELIKNVNKIQLREISIELVHSENFGEFIQNENAKRVIQELIKRQDKDDNDEICEKIYNNFIPFCKNEYASFIIETLLNNCNDYYYGEMLLKCKDNLLDLINNKYGCHIVCFFIKDNFDILFESIINNILNISRMQFGVLVLRTIKDNNDQNLRDQIVNEIKSDINNLIYLSKDQYGNFVVQEILEFLDQNTKNYLKKKLLKLNYKQYSKHVLQKLQ